MEHQDDAVNDETHQRPSLTADLRLSEAGLSAFKGDHLSKGVLDRFLERAQDSDLGPEPILLVEAIDDCRTCWSPWSALA